MDRIQEASVDMTQSINVESNKEFDPDRYPILLVARALIE